MFISFCSFRRLVQQPCGFSLSEPYHRFGNGKPPTPRFGSRESPQNHLFHGNRQRGLQRFFGQILTIYSRFCSVSFTLRHSLKTVFPRVPCLSVAVYVVKKIVTPKGPLHKHNKVLCNTLNFHPCISPFIPIDFRLLFRYCVACKSPTKH